MKTRITTLITVMLLGVLLVFTNSSTVEAKSKLKKSTTVTVKTLNKSTVKKVDKAFRSAKVVKVKVKASSKKKAEKMMAKLEVKLCEYTELFVYINYYWCKKQGGYYVFENNATVTKEYRGYNDIYVACDKVDTKIAKKIHNLFLEQVKPDSDDMKYGITIAYKAKSKKDGAKKQKELLKELKKCNIYGFTTTDDTEGDYYDKDTGLYYAEFSDDDVQSYCYGMQLVQTMWDIRKAEWQASIDSGDITAERAAELQQRINTNFCDYSTAMKYYILEPLWHIRGEWCYYDYITYAGRGYMKIEDIPEERKALIEERKSRQTNNEFYNILNQSWTGVCEDYKRVEQRLFYCLGWSSKDLSATMPRPDHIYSVIKVTNSDGVTGWVHCDYGTFNIKVNGEWDTDYKWN